MKIERYICCYDDDSWDELFEIDITSLPIATLEEIFTPGADDPLLYTSRSITEMEATQLCKYIDIAFDFSKNGYFMRCKVVGEDGSRSPYHPPPKPYVVRPMIAKRFIIRIDPTINHEKKIADIDSLSLEVLKEIFTPRVDDPFLYLPYEIHEAEAEKLRHCLEVEFDLDKFNYTMDCSSGATAG
jgi:hypothetical protein